MSKLSLKEMLVKPIENEALYRSCPFCEPKKCSEANLKSKPMARVSSLTLNDIFPTLPVNVAVPFEVTLRVNG